MNVRIILSPYSGMHVCTDSTSVVTLIRKSFGRMEHVNFKGKIPSTGKKFSPEEDRTHDAASSRTVSPTLYQRAIPAPSQGSEGQHEGLRPESFISKYPIVAFLLVLSPASVYEQVHSVQILKKNESVLFIKNHLNAV